MEYSSNIASATKEMGTQLCIRRILYPPSTFHVIYIALCSLNYTNMAVVKAYEVKVNAHSLMTYIITLEMNWIHVYRINPFLCVNIQCSSPAIIYGPTITHLHSIETPCK